MAKIQQIKGLSVELMWGTGHTDPHEAESRKRVRRNSVGKARSRASVRGFRDGCLWP